MEPCPACVAIRRDDTGVQLRWLASRLPNLLPCVGQGVPLQLVGIHVPEFVVFFARWSDAAKAVAV
jgi:hypothetical protein